MASVTTHCNPGTLMAGNPSFLRECSRLYSGHYGFWATPNPDGSRKPVALSPDRIRTWLLHDDSCIAFARHEGLLVAYAIAIQEHVHAYGVVTWVSQLVVHKTYRKRNVATVLLHSLWGFSDHYAWGLISANPYAVRALEAATRRRCDKQRIAQDKDMLMKMGKNAVPYVSYSTSLEIDDNTCRINTDFDLDHSSVPQMITNVTDDSKPWTLGELRERCEWFAFTFNDQPQSQWTRKEAERMLHASDEVTREAYSRMTLGPGHLWATHTADEVNFIYEECRLQTGMSILDFGCGSGRHSYVLATHGMRVCGVDFSHILIRDAIDAANADNIPVEYVLGDCRTIDLRRTFDCILCLYDVIGSFVDKSDNYKIMRNIAKHLAPGGHAIISVMNMACTSAIATQTFHVSTELHKLQLLPPSDTMEQTGGIFNPAYFLLDKTTGIVYRKEQFRLGGELPAELLVRDRRYYPKEIENLMKSVGLEVLWCRCVRSGDWQADFSDDDRSAKEILLLCRQPN